PATTPATLAGVGIPGVGTVLSANANQTFRTTDNIIRVGLNYKWAGAVDRYGRPAYTPPPAYAPPPAYSWNDWYSGANVGYGWGDARYDAALNASALGFFVPEIGAGQATAGTAISGSQKIDGVIGGVQTGYNYQFGAWVWGLETDFQGSGQNGSSTFARTFNNPIIGPIPVSATTDHKLQWFGTTRGRLGFLWSPNVLLYGTAGVAYGQVKDSETFNGSALGGAVTAPAPPPPQHLNA